MSICNSIWWSILSGFYACTIHVNNIYTNFDAIFIRFSCLSKTCHQMSDVVNFIRFSCLFILKPSFMTAITRISLIFMFSRLLSFSGFHACYSISGFHACYLFQVFMPVVSRFLVLIELPFSVPSSFIQDILAVVIRF